jgi:[acyl-carrier-protein] S-malonyltransferase
MHEASVQNPGAMASILGLDAAQLQALEAQAAAKGPVVLANFNCPGQIVVSGAVDAVDELCGLATAAGAKRCIKLNVSGAFHSRLMQPAAEKLAALLERVEIRPPKIPVIANVTASPVSDPSEIRALLVKQITSPVLWEQSMRRLLTDGFGRFVEIGPGKVLAGLMRRIDRNVEMGNYEGE